MDPETLILQALREAPAPWPNDVPSLEAALLDAADAGGVMALLATAPGVESWPGPVRIALRSALRAEAAIEAIRKAELARLLDAFHVAGVRALLLKGARMAYTVYPEAWLRPRVDTDLLVDLADRWRADAVMRSLGYAPHTHFDGHLVTHQFEYERRSPLGTPELVDLHWKIANPHAFADLFTARELLHDAIPITPLGAGAWGPSDVHMFLIACLHRVAHHDNSDRLIWLYDLHLLATAMSPAERDAAEVLAGAKGLRAVCARGLERARGLFGTAVPPEWLAARPGDRHREPTAAFLESGRTKVDVLVSDLHALPGWRTKLQLIREHLFPPAAYVRQSYGVSTSALLPLVYAHRILRGVRRWVRS